MFQLITKQLPFRCPNHFQVIARPSTSHEGHKGRPCLTTGPLDLRGQLWHSATLPMASQHLRKEPYGAKLGVSGNGEKTPRTTVLTKNMMINRQFSGYPILRETGSSSIQMIEILGTIWIEIWILAKISYIYIWYMINMASSSISTKLTKLRSQKRSVLRWFSTGIMTQWNDPYDPWRMIETAVVTGRLCFVCFTLHGR